MTPVNSASRSAALTIAAAGFVDVTRERVMFAPHLPWRGEPVRERLQERLGAPVVLDAPRSGIAKSLEQLAARFLPAGAEPAKKRGWR